METILSRTFTAKYTHRLLFILTGALLFVGCHDSTPVDIVQLPNIDTDSDIWSDSSSEPQPFDTSGGKILSRDTARTDDSSPDSETEQEVTDGKSWTIMLYMDADSNIEADMLADLTEVSQVEVPEWLNILVLFDRHEDYDVSDGNWTGTRLFKVDPGVPGGLMRLADSSFLQVSNFGDNEELDMGDVNTLEKFMDYSMAQFPSDYYAVILSGHGNGWSKKGPVSPGPDPKFICADDSGSADGISIQIELKPLLERKQIDVIGFDACLMGMVEVAWAVKDSVQYMIASEANEASYGWDYYNWLTRWIDGSHSARQLAVDQVESYRDFHITWNLEPWLMTMAAIDVSKLDALGDAIDILVDQNDVPSFVHEAMTFDDYYNYYFDLWDIADLAGDDNLKAAIEAVVFSSWNSDNQSAPGGLSILYYAGQIYEYQMTSFCQDVDWC